MLEISNLTINPDIVCNLILKAREFHAKEAVTIPEDTPDSEYEYDWAQILADHYDDLTYQEIHNTIAYLEYEQQVDLLALMYLGREDFDNLTEAQTAAVTNLPANLTDYLLAHPFLADYLENGLSLFGDFCDE